MMTTMLPLSTYRLQLSSDFGFDDAAKLVPYLKALGITHLYSSPFLKARKGSKHGYDIVDHGALNPEFGGESAFVRLSEALRDAGLGLILDFVPNHMGIGYADNSWWLDVLEWGQQSPHADAFDITWELLPYRRGGGVLLPVLGKPYGEVLHSGEISLKYDAGQGTFSAWYFDHRFPISPQRYGEIIKSAVVAAAGANEPAGRALVELADAHAHPHAPSYADAANYKRQLAAIEGGAALIECGLSAYNAVTDDGRQALHRLLERQHYRIAYWRVSVSGINYRRFFDINELAGLRVEDPQVFNAIHVLVERLIKENRLQGLRLDHIDGLRDPLQYTRRLGNLIRNTRKADAAGFHVTVEKILGEDERPPRFPGVHGTTGYEWLNVISRLLVDERSLPALEQTWREFSGEHRPFSEILLDAKQRVIETILTSEFTVLTQLLARLAAGHYSTRDYTPDRLRAALQGYVLEFPVYRTYVTSAGASPADRIVIERTIAAARAHWPGSDPEIFDFLREVITLDLLGNRSYSRSRIRNFTHRLQQFTGPLMAKSLEDTAFYRYHRLLALNEVGNDPSSGGISVNAFHERMSARVREAPLGLTATATHDTKRGEDARMRILALSELPDEWSRATAQWRDMTRTMRGSQHVPTPAHEYMFYQALIGAWPFTAIDRAFVERMQAYAVKAAREGKQQTSWVNTNESYEQALRQFVADILDSQNSGEFLRSFEAFVRRPALLGALNSLSQLVLKVTMPGVPDFYQGTEFWDLSLVDPDNRRPMDFHARESVLNQNSVDWSMLHETWREGHVKIVLMQRLLALRNKLPQLFIKGAYQELEVTGRDADHVVAFTRSNGSDRVVVAVGRHFSALTEQGQRWPRNWQGNIQLRARGLTDAIGSVDGPVTLDLNALFARLPIAVIRVIE